MNVIRMSDQSLNGLCSVHLQPHLHKMNWILLTDWKAFALQLARIKKIIASFSASNFCGRESLTVESPRERALIQMLKPEIII